MKFASLTGFLRPSLPAMAGRLVISCMSGRRVGWTTPRGQNGEGRRNRAFDLVHVMHPLC